MLLSYTLLTHFVLVQTKVHFKISITLGHFISFYSSLFPVFIFFPFLVALSLFGNNPGHLTSECKSTIFYLPILFYFLLCVVIVFFFYLFWASASLKALEVSWPKADLLSLFSHVGKLQTRQQRGPGVSGRADDGAV